MARTSEGPRRDLGGTPEGPRRDPGGTPEGPRRDPGGTQEGPRRDLKWSQVSKNCKNVDNDIDLCFQIHLVTHYIKIFLRTNGTEPLV